VCPIYIYNKYNPYSVARVHKMVKIKKRAIIMMYIWTKKSTYK